MGGADAPLFATDVGTRYDPDWLMEYIQEGLLAAVVLHPERGVERIVIGPDNLEDMPGEPPYEF